MSSDGLGTVDRTVNHEKGVANDIGSIQDSVTLERIMTDALNGIYGIPYQFLSSVDRRLSDDIDIGRKYADKIVSRMPLLFLTPGKQVFMEGFSSSDKKNVIDMILSGMDIDPNTVINNYGKYYTFEFDSANYFRYVNTMCWIVAKYLGIDNVNVTIGAYSGKLGNMDWSKAQNSDFGRFFTPGVQHQNIVYYLDSFVSVSESFSNDTGESQLANQVNGLSETTQEIQFILGSGNSMISNLVEGLGDIGSSITSGLSGIISNTAGGLLGGLLGHGTNTILSGGKIVFPEIWKNSGFDRSYSLDVKLRSPDNDSLSIYLNILVPYIHLLAMTLPRGLDGSTDSKHVDPNGYTSPFLVRAYCKGMFNIDQGIITDLSASKGGECCWNDDGLPTQIDLSLTIKDLYSNMFMTAIKNDIISHPSVVSVVCNTSMIDFLANMSGLNLAQEEIGRRTMLYNYLTSSYYTSYPSRVWSKFDDKIANFMGKLYQTF